MEYREFRANGADADDEGKLYGLVAPFGSETVIGDLKRGGFREEIAPGAFKKTLSEGDVLLLVGHDTRFPLARTSAGTLALREESGGLHFEANPADTSYARDLRVNIKAGNTRGMSIGFEPVKDEWFNDKGEPSNCFDGTRRVLREVKLREVSTVTMPAYTDTSLFARDSLLAEREERASKPYGNVKYADPKNGKYPVNTADRVRAAWSYINQAKNAAKYPLNGVSLSNVKAAIKAAAKQFGIKISKRDAYPYPEYCPRHAFDPCGEKRCDEALTPADIREQRIKKGTKKRVLEMHAELHQAMDLFGKNDISKLPDEAQQAVALVSAAMTHVGHIKDVENVNADDLSRSEQKPETSTSAEDERRMDALMFAEFAQLSREAV